MRIASIYIHKWRIIFFYVDTVSNCFYWVLYDVNDRAIFMFISKIRWQNIPVGCWRLMYLIFFCKQIRKKVIWSPRNFFNLYRIATDIVSNKISYQNYMHILSLYVVLLRNLQSIFLSTDFETTITL
jgi:hypothetical protein